MKIVTEVVGIVLLVQGIGGAISKIVDGSKSWFLTRHVLPEGLQIPASVIMVLIGVALLWSIRDRQRT
ncbi:hypothetical protein EV193_11291 [Herbihabitans rhizosphaerae]|uniref:Uncharacterized protein n=1 Tax=Herbihabitans rhizosphaerae TaxID=1872711 RepID=A0A4Q7KGT3_9PSEU|nr:hypothetical protein [Herbihabitans rhizosphaerae]RZS32457.1 hypothetical protein EV193_11291 [Herbihabitans rhizosphaerae]